MENHFWYFISIELTIGGIGFFSLSSLFIAFFCLFCSLFCVDKIHFCVFCYILGPCLSICASWSHGSVLCVLCVCFEIDNEIAERHWQCAPQYEWSMYTALHSVVFVIFFASMQEVTKVLSDTFSIFARFFFLLYRPFSFSSRPISYLLDVYSRFFVRIIFNSNTILL